MAGDERASVVFDIDGVLCEETGLPDDYERRAPLPVGIALLRRVREKGFRIVLHSARYLEDTQVTLEWLAQNEVPFDALVLGKPKAVAYIDDRAIRYPLGGFDRALLEDILARRRRR